MASVPNFSPFVRHAENHTTTVPWTVSARQLWDYELLYVKEGQLRITIEDRVYDGAPGDIFILKPRERHSILLLGTQPLQQPHVHFDLIEQLDSPNIRISFRQKEEMSETEKGQFRIDHLSDGPYTLPNYIQLPHPKTFEIMLYQLIQEYSMKLPLYEINCKALLLQILTYLVRELHWSRSPNVQNHLQTLMNIQQHLHLSDHEITLNELADRFRISKYYLNRLFSDAFGIGPIHYHQNMRIQKAKQMLQYTNLSIQQIADQLGYSSIHSFSRAFKNKEGMSPSLYRKG